MSSEERVWGTGYGSRRHLSSADDPNRSLCSPPSLPSRLDWFSDDESVFKYGNGKQTTRDVVMDRKPCLRCCKRAGLS